MALFIGEDNYLVSQKNKNKYKSLAYGLPVFLVIIIMWYFVLRRIGSLESPIYPIIFYLVILFLQKYADKFLIIAKKYKHGLLGEQYVEKILHNLPDNYHVFVSVVLPDQQSNIDFVVVGPTGVWAIEVKNKSGLVSIENDQLLINGQLPERNYLKQTYAEALSLGKYMYSNLNISIETIPVLVFSHYFSKMYFGVNPQRGVYVIKTAWLCDLIKNHKTTINNEYIDKLSSVLSVLVNKSM